MIRFLRFFLFPLSLLYGLITGIRNVLFDFGILPSYQSAIKTISIGNLSTGGSGKTPFTELLIRQLGINHRIAVISRGYGRKTKGFFWVNPESDALKTGDEPLQIKRKFPDVLVAVCEKRSDAIRRIETDFPLVDLIILDDAFQHRYVKAHVSILLSVYTSPFWKDFVLPAGNLREWRNSYKRADYVVVTKCPMNLSADDCKMIRKSIKSRDGQEIYFAGEKYGKTYGLFSGETVEPEFETCLLVSGIASNNSLLAYISGLFKTVVAFRLTDHVTYDKKVIGKITEKYNALARQGRTAIVVTEKDAVKLREFSEELSSLPILVLPFEHNLKDIDSFIKSLEAKLL